MRQQHKLISTLLLALASSGTLLAQSGSLQRAADLPEATRAGAALASVEKAPVYTGVKALSSPSDTIGLNLTDAQKAEAMESFKQRYPLLANRMEVNHSSSELKSPSLAYAPLNGESNAPEIWASVAYDPGWTTPNDYNISSFEASSPINFERQGKTDNYFNAGVAIKDGKLYGMYYYNYYGIYIIETLYAYDTETWEQTQPAQSLGAFNLIAMETAQAQDGTVYGQFLNSDVSKLEYGVIDYENLTRTTFGTGTITMIAMGITSDNRLYGIGMDGNLYEISTADGTETLIGPTGVSDITNSNGQYYSQTGEIDPKTNTFYWEGINANTSVSTLYTVDLATGHATAIGDFPNGAELTGFVNPLPAAADDAPAKVRDLALNFPNGNTSGTVSFTAPSQTYAGSNLTGDVSWTLTANGQEVANGTAQPGSKQNAQVSVSEGNNDFVLVTANAAGNSPKTKVSAYIGYDKPSVPTNISLAIADNGNTNLTWDAPVKGVHNGYLGTLTYNVYQHKASVDSLVASKITDTHYATTLPLGQVAKYSYRVEAVNRNLVSDRASSNTVLAGKPFDVPYIETFDDASALDLFTIYNNNNDQSTWGYAEQPLGNGTAQHTFSVNPDDDWLITPPISLKGGKQYTLSFRAFPSQGYPETLEVKYGQDEEIADLGTTILEPTEISAQDSTYSVKLNPTQDGSYNIGFHDITQALSIYLYIDDLLLEADVTNEAPDSVSALAITPDQDGTLKAQISFVAPTKLVNGNELTSIDSIVVRNKSRIVESVKAQPGQSLTVTDDSPIHGNNDYSVIAYNAAGNGRKAEKVTYVGIDAPQNPIITETLDKDTYVHVAWEQYPTVGAHGGVVKPENVQTSVMRMTFDDFGMHIDTVGTVTGQTSYDIPYNTNEGDPYLAEWYLVGHTEGGETGGIAFSVPTGRHDHLPWYESVNGGRYQHAFWTGRIAGDNYWVTSNLLSADNDGGSAAYSGPAGCASSINTYKISLDSTANPELVFSDYATPGKDVDFKVTVQRPDGTTDTVFAENYKDVTGSDPSWRQHKVKLSKYSNDSYVIIGFIAATNEGDNVGLDKISITDVKANDLAVSLKAPKSVAKGQKASVAVIVDNIGDNDAAGYDVKFFDGESLIKDSTINENLGSFASDTIYISVPTSSIDTAKTSIALKAQVIAAADEVAGNNEATGTIQLDKSDANSPELLTAEGGDNGDVVLSWTAPKMTATPVKDDFESYDPWTLEYGKWTTYDGDGHITYYFSGYNFPHMMEPYAFIVYNPSNIGIDPSMYTGFAPHSGNQYLCSFDAAPATGETTAATDHWLISPRLSGEKQTVTFYAGVPTNAYGEEDLEVLASSTGNDPSDFTSVGSYAITNIIQGNNWGDSLTIDLPEGTTFFAVRHNTPENHLCVFLDDFSFIAGSGAPVSYNIYRDGKLIGSTDGDASGFDVTDNDGNEHTYAVTAVYDDGQESEPVYATTSVPTGISEIINDASGKPVDIYDLSGRLIRRNAVSTDGMHPGVYIINDRKFVIK